MDKEIKWEYLEPFSYTPTEAEILARLLSRGCAILPRRLMTAEEIAEEYGITAPQPTPPQV